MAEIRIYSDADRLARAAAEYFVTLAAEAIAVRGQFSVALSGGSTPRATYALLASNEFAVQVDWSRVHLFWGDERCVPPDHPGSNYRMAREALLDKVPIPTENIHRIRGEINPEEAAADYERTLRSFFARRPEGSTARFDLILLGMGEDGHTASLFTGTAALEERKRPVVAVYVERLNTWRVTLTLPTINAARHVLFLVSGAAKARVVQAVLEGPEGQFPAQQICLASGQLTWLLDAAAAGQLGCET